DAAGNGLAAAFAWSFWTATDAVILQNTMPVNGATGVPINSTVWLQFSRDMNMASLSGGVTVTSPDKAEHSFSVDASGNVATLTFDDDLPASKTITVSLSTNVQAHDGTPLAAATSFSFTTGSTADDTPPNLLSLEPTDGSVIPTSTNFVRLTFDEAIDDSSLTPTLVSGQFMLSLTSTDDVGVWTENGSVFTIGLDPPLIPGSIFRVVFESFADIHGNVNTTGFEWEVTVAGTAVNFPLEDDWIMAYWGTWWEYPIRSTGAYQMFTKYEAQTGDEWWRYELGFRGGSDPPKSQFDFTDYDRLRLTTSGILFLGFHEDKEPPEEDFDLTFVPPVEYLRLPLTTDEWGGTSQFDPTPPAGEPSQVEYTVEVLPGSFDVLGPSLERKDDPVETTIIWPSCRKLVTTHELSDGETTYGTGVDTLWVSPGIGIVRKWSEFIEDQTIYRTDASLGMAGFESDFDDE
ncbi:MAG: Ig-like domain-containing protein, partial [bacterium]